MVTAIDTDVLIVGAGPTGLALACELARSGISHCIIEASAGPQKGSRGKGIQPRTLEVFDNLGLVDRVLANGRLGMPIRSFDAQGNVTLGGSGPGEPRPETPYTATLLIPQWRVEEALRNRLAEFGGHVTFGVELSGFAERDGGVSGTVIEHGDVRNIAARWLIGCDGGHSTVRNLAGIPFLGETMEAIRMIVADVRADGMDRDFWHMWRGDEGFIALCPLPSTNEFQLQASIAPGQTPDLSLANLQSMFETRSGRSDIRLHEPGWTSLWRANVRMVDRYRSGRVFLAGDAAHVHSPAGGQGMNTGIQDAHNLGWKLAAVIKGASPALLDTYQEERLPIAAGVLALSNELLRKAVEERGLQLRRDERTTQLGLGYRGSSLARDNRSDDAVLRSGDRAPQAPGLITAEGQRTLFDLLRGEHFALLMFGEVRPGTTPAPACPSPAVSTKTYQVVHELRTPGDVIDSEGHLARTYGATDGTVVLIRPDGYVALIFDGFNDSGVSDYFRDFLGAASPAES